MIFSLPTSTTVYFEDPAMIPASEIEPFFRSFKEGLLHLALLDEPKRTNWSLLRTRSSPIRTAAALPFQVKIPLFDDLPVYQALSPKIKQLKALGLTNQEIADQLQISRKTVAKGTKI